MLKITGLCILMLITAGVQAATFCVDTSSELQAVLDAADSNGQADVIKIVGGTYLSSNGGFIYENFNENYDLQISGGWVSSNENCDSQPQGAADSTVLDGDNQVRGLAIYPGSTAANISISNITFINGLAEDTLRGGGLNIAPLDGYEGIVTVTQSQFVNNTGRVGSALSINRGSRINVKNNLFVINTSDIGHVVNLDQLDHIGIYFTNNTILNNASKGLRLTVNGSSKALIANNLFWNNATSSLDLYGTGLKYVYNNDIDTVIINADFAANNFTVTPEFSTGDFLDYTPAWSSSMINHGFQPIWIPAVFTQNWSLGSKDVLGRDRVQDDHVDIGAFEAAAEPVIFVAGFE